MCHRFHIKTSSTSIAEVLGAKNRSGQDAHQKDLFPLQSIPIARLDQDGALELTDCTWSLLYRGWKPSKKIASWRSFVRKYPTFNARSESIAEKASFRKSFQDRRALVPCSGFYEHGQYFGVKDQETYFLAGLWDRCKVDEQWLDSFTIVTTASNETVGKYHPKKRMPVILADADARRLWMDHEADRQVLAHLFEPFDDEQMHCWPMEPAPAE